MSLLLISLLRELMTGGLQAGVMLYVMGPEELGRQLRRARQHMGLSLRDVHAVTAIPLGCLAALEEGRLEQLLRGHPLVVGARIGRLAVRGGVRRKSRVPLRIGARRTFFTHLTHDATHAALAARLPPGVAPAYDGLVIDVPEP